MFGDDRNNNERGRRPSQTILSETGYRTFSTATSSIWSLATIVFWVISIEIHPSKEVISTIAGSSVELAALSLAVLGILHELNRKDKWFKVGLLLVSISFAGVVFGGFFVVLTWQPAFDAPQQITLIVITALSVVAGMQFDWRFILRRVRLRI